MVIKSNAKLLKIQHFEWINSSFYVNHFGHLIQHRDLKQIGSCPGLKVPDVSLINLSVLWLQVKEKAIPSADQ